MTMEYEDRKEVQEMIEKAVASHNEKLEIYLKGIDTKLISLCSSMTAMTEKVNSVEREQLLRAQSCPFRSVVEQTSRAVDRAEAIKSFVWKVVIGTVSIWGAAIIILLKYIL